SGLGGGVDVVEPGEVDTAAHRLDGPVEAVLREEIAGQLRGHSDVVRLLEAAAQVLPRHRGGGVEDGARGTDVRADVVRHEVVRRDDGDVPLLRQRHGVASDDEVRLCVDDIGSDVVE